MFCWCGLYFSGTRSRVPGRLESPREMTSKEVLMSSVGDKEDEGSSHDTEVSVVAAVVVDEEAIAAGVRAAQYNMLEEIRSVHSHNSY
jgi:hypothetical protein